jgi:hypothetical protein
MDNRSEFTPRERVLDRIRYFNREYFNPFALSFAGRPNSFWSVILHTGRCSGKEYVTPIVTARQNDHFMIPLPYGREVDWLKNVMAAENCLLIHRGKVYQASQPETIDLDEGIAAFPALIQRLLRRSDAKAVLRFNQSCEAPDGPSLYKIFADSYPAERGLWILAALWFLLIGIGRRLSRQRRGN